MKQVWFVLGIGVGCLLAAQVYAEASVVSHAVSNIWNFLFSPINCVGNLTVAIWGDTVSFVQCVISNANVSRLIP